MKYLIDTNIIVYSLKSQGNVAKYLEEHEYDDKYMSIITYGELYYGAEKSSAKQKNLETLKKVELAYPILPIDKNVMQTFGSIKAELNRKGLSSDNMDLLIAATALVNNCVLVTHNTKHFANINDIVTEDWYS